MEAQSSQIHIQRNRRPKSRQLCINFASFLQIGNSKVWLHCCWSGSDERVSWRNSMGKWRVQSQSLRSLGSPSLAMDCNLHCWVKWTLMFDLLVVTPLPTKAYISSLSELQKSNSSAGWWSESMAGFIGIVLQSKMVGSWVDINSAKGPRGHKQRIGCWRACAVGETCATKTWTCWKWCQRWTWPAFK